MQLRGAGPPGSSAARGIPSTGEDCPPGSKQCSQGVHPNTHQHTHSRTHLHKVLVPCRQPRYPPASLTWTPCWQVPGDAPPSGGDVSVPKLTSSSVGKMPPRQWSSRSGLGGTPACTALLCAGRLRLRDAPSQGAPFRIRTTLRLPGSTTSWVETFPAPPFLLPTGRGPGQSRAPPRRLSHCSCGSCRARPCAARRGRNPLSSAGLAP